MLAIVIPYYKKAYFKECLDSLAKQSNKNFKIYVGDDASPEDPKNLLQEYEGKLDFSYHRFSENLGQISLTKQWHRCINLSEGEEWLMILGDDDFLSSNYVEEFYRNLPEIENLKIKVLRFASRIVRSPSNELSPFYTHPKLEKASDFIYRRYFEKSRGSLTEQIFRRDVFLKYGFQNIPLAWGADLYAWLQFSENEANFAVNEALAYFRISEHNISRGGFKEQQKANARIIFFSDYLLPGKNYFTKNQILKLIGLFEKILYKHKRFHPKYVGMIAKRYLKYRKLDELLKFLRRLIIHYAKNAKYYNLKKGIYFTVKTIKYQIYRARRKCMRIYQESRKTEFERRIWKRQQLLFDTDHKKELSNFKLFVSDDFSVWKNMECWQRRLENKLNAKEFVQKCGIRTAKRIWNGRLEDFANFDFSLLPENFTVKPVRGEATKNVFLMNNGTNLFEGKIYDEKLLRAKIQELYNSGIKEILIEEFLANEDGEFKVPNDYRFYVFNGHIKFIQLDKRSGFEKDQVSFYDENWKLIENKILVDAVTNNIDDPPKCFEEMKTSAVELSLHYKNFVRIDFYATNKGAVFGEFTPTPRKGKFLTKFGNKQLIHAWDNHVKDMF